MANQSLKSPRESRKREIGTVVSKQQKDFDSEIFAKEWMKNTRNSSVNSYFQSSQKPHNQVRTRQRKKKGFMKKSMDNSQV